MQVTMHFLILCAHLFLAKVLIKKEATRFKIINLGCFIFAGQQLQLYMRYEPIQVDQVSAYQNFHDQSFIQLLCCGCMVGSFLPLFYYLAPICLIYAGSFWAVYLNKKQCLMQPHEVTWRFCCQLILTVATVYLFQATLQRASNLQSETPSPNKEGEFIFDESC